MRDVISRAPATDDSRLMGAFIVLSLVLTSAAIGFGVGVFIDLSTAVLGVLLALSFISIAGMTLTYHRLFHDHRIFIEYDEDLW
ncbi:MAG: hypothetical protein ABEJ67_02890 [Halanaeroarchaeum sp.]